MSFPVEEMTANGSKWIFNLKKSPDIQERRYKVRLIIIGCGQQPSFDYDETFAFRERK